MAQGAGAFVTPGLGLRFESHLLSWTRVPLYSLPPRRAREGSGESVKSSWEFTGW